MEPLTDSDDVWGRLDAWVAENNGVNRKVSMGRVDGKFFCRLRRGLNHPDAYWGYSDVSTMDAASVALKLATSADRERFAS